jgi:hypothetical protein
MTDLVRALQACRFGISAPSVLLCDPRFERFPGGRRVWQRRRATPTGRALIAHETFTVCNCIATYWGLFP